jgi:hypothetical protein
VGPRAEQDVCGKTLPPPGLDLRAMKARASPNKSVCPDKFGRGKKWI